MTPLVLIHGFTGRASSFEPLRLDSQMWAPSAPITCFELHGHGTCPDLTADCFEAEVKRLRQHIAAHCDAPPILVGYSMGARLALGLSVHFPGIVSRLVLIGVNPGVRSAPERNARLEWEQEWIHMLEQEGLTTFVARWESQALFASQRDTDPRAMRAQTQVRLEHTAGGLASALRVLGLAAMPSYWNRLKTITAPTSLLVGENDQKFVNLAHEIRATVPDWTLDLVPGVGHNLLLEAPDHVRQVIGRVVRSCKAASPLLLP